LTYFFEAHKQTLEYLQRQ